MRSEVVKVQNKLFRYDYENCLVEYVSEVTDEIKADNKEWQEKYHRDLFEVVDGYVVNGTVGLRKENWDNPDAREEYLSEWIMDMEEELSYLMEEFL